MSFVVRMCVCMSVCVRGEARGGNCSGSRNIEAGKGMSDGMY